jgi:hypothetical protein
MLKRRILYLASTLSFIIWWGGFTFYASVVVPIGMRILGSHVIMGLITERVSIYINALCGLAIMLGFWYLLAYKPTFPKKRWKFMLLNLLFLGAFLIGLSVLHTIMDGYLDIQGKKVTDEPYFYYLHRIYLLTSTLMWLQGVVHLISILKNNEGN